MNHTDHTQAIAVVVSIVLTLGLIILMMIDPNTY